MSERRAYSRHGMNALKARVKVRGMNAIDRRTAAGRALLERRADLVRDLGGEESISAQQAAVIEQTARLWLYVDVLDRWILEQESVVNKRRKSVLPVLRERAALGDSLLRHLQALGLERRIRAVPALASYLATRERPAELRSEAPTKDEPETVEKDERQSAQPDGAVSGAPRTSACHEEE